MVIKAFQRYYRLIIINLILVFALRLAELILISVHHRLIGMSTYPPGMYFIQFKTTDSQMSRKIIKE